MPVRSLSSTAGTAGLCGIKLFLRQMPIFDYYRIFGMENRPAHAISRWQPSRLASRQAEGGQFTTGVEGSGVPASPARFFRPPIASLRQDACSEELLSEYPACETSAAGQHEVVGGFADCDRMFAGGNAPLVRPRVEFGEQPRIGSDRHRARGTGFELDSFEAKQPLPLLAGSFCQIKLRNVGTGSLPGVGHGKPRGNRFTAADIQIAIGKTAVAQPVTERVHRSCVLLRVPAVADFGTFVIAHRGRCSIRRAETRQGGARCLSEIDGKGDWQAA